MTDTEFHIRAEKSTRRGSRPSRSSEKGDIEHLPAFSGRKSGFCVPFFRSRFERPGLAPRRPNLIMEGGSRAGGSESTPIFPGEENRLVPVRPILGQNNKAQFFPKKKLTQGNGEVIQGIRSPFIAASRFLASSNSGIPGSASFQRSRKMRYCATALSFSPFSS